MGKWTRRHLCIDCSQRSMHRLCSTETTYKRHVIFTATLEYSQCTVCFCQYAITLGIRRTQCTMHFSQPRPVELGPCEHGPHLEVWPLLDHQMKCVFGDYTSNRVSNRSAGMISRRHFHENSAEFAVLSTFTGQGH